MVFGSRRQEPRRAARRRLATFRQGTLLALATVWFGALAAWAGSAGAQSSPGPDRDAVIARVVHLVNEERLSAGLAPVRPEPVLAETSQRWAERLASDGQLSHDPHLDRVPTDWRKLGENVGYGPDPDAVHAAFLASPSHAANVLDPEVQRIGVGVTVVGDRLYIVERFEDPMPRRSGIRRSAAH